MSFIIAKNTLLRSICDDVDGCCEMQSERSTTPLVFTSVRSDERDLHPSSGPLLSRKEKVLLQQTPLLASSASHPNLISIEENRDETVQLN